MKHAYFLHTGYGKTKMCLDKIRKAKRDLRVIIISTVKVVETSWQAEMNKWYPGIFDYDYITGRVKESKRHEVLKKMPQIFGLSTSMLEWYVANTCRIKSKVKNKADEVERIIYDIEALSKRFDLIIIDESSLFKNYGSERFKVMKKWVHKSPNVMLLSATPSPKNIENIWAQIYLLDGGKRLGTSITKFREEYAIAIPMANGRLRYQYSDAAVNEVLNLIKDMVTSIPYPDKPLFPEPKLVRLNIKPDPETHALLKQFKEDYITQIGEKQLLAMSKNQLIIKVRQLASGSVYIKNSTIRVNDLKINALKYKLEQIDTPVLVYYKHIFEKDQLLELEGSRLLDTPQDFADWNANKIKLGVLSPFSAAHGLNMQDSECRHIFWFSPIWDAEIWIQANARVCRRGQRYTVTIGIFLLKESFDKMVFDICIEKYKAQYNHLEKLK